MRWIASALVLLTVAAVGGWAVVAHRADGAAPVADHAAAPVAIPPVKPRLEVAHCRAGRVLPIGAGARAAAVVVVRPTSARRAPNGRAFARFGLQNANGVRTVFGALARRVDAACRPTWYRVQLPMRPNGTTGWVRASDVQRFTVAARVTVDLSERTVTLYRAGRLVLRVRAAIGKPLTPTPTGRFYVNQRLLAENPDGVFGPGGVGISAFSPTLQRWAQGGPIAIHGTDRPDLIGQEVSHGCVRIRNEALRTLLRLAPEGTPVVIRV